MEGIVLPIFAWRDLGGGLGAKISKSRGNLNPEGNIYISLWISRTSPAICYDSEFPRQQAWGKSVARWIIRFPALAIGFRAWKKTLCATSTSQCNERLTAPIWNLMRWVLGQVGAHAERWRLYLVCGSSAQLWKIVVYFCIKRYFCILHPRKDLRTWFCAV